MASHILCIEYITSENDLQAVLYRQKPPSQRLMTKKAAPTRKEITCQKKRKRDEVLPFLLFFL